MAEEGLAVQNWSDQVREVCGGVSVLAHLDVWTGHQEAGGTEATACVMGITYGSTVGR